MKNLIQNTITKKILIALVLVVIATCFIAPNEVHAADFLSDLGKDLIEAFFQFLTFLGDLLLQVMQSMMVGGWDIEDDYRQVICTIFPRYNFFR